MKKYALLFAAISVLALFVFTTVHSDEHEGLPHAVDAGWMGEDVCELLFENELVMIGKCVFPPGVGHEKHYHNPHFGYILDGTTFRVTDEDGVEDLEVAAGVTWSSDTISVHEALNVGETTGSALIVEFKQQ